jgi:clan AA aspartic protease
MKSKTFIRHRAELQRGQPVMQKCYVANPLKPREGQEVSFVVDTGSSGLVIPSLLAKQLRLKPVGEGDSQLADGTVIQSKIAWVYIRINGESVHTLAIIIDKAQPLLGIDVMRILQLQIDPANERLLKPVKRLSLLRIRWNKGAFRWKTLFAKP